MRCVGALETVVGRVVGALKHRDLWDLRVI